MRSFPEFGQCCSLKNFLDSIFLCLAVDWQFFLPATYLIGAWKLPLLLQCPISCIVLLSCMAFVLFIGLFLGMNLRP